MILGPMMLSEGVSPQVTTAVNSTLVLFASSSAALVSRYSHGLLICKVKDISNTSFTVQYITSEFCYRWASGRRVVEFLFLFMFWLIIYRKVLPRLPCESHRFSQLNARLLIN